MGGAPYGSYAAAFCFALVAGLANLQPPYQTVFQTSSSLRLPPAASATARAARVQSLIARSRKLVEQRELLEQWERDHGTLQSRPAAAPAPERFAFTAAAGPSSDVQAARLAAELHETKQRLALAEAVGGELRRERDDLAARLSAAGCFRVACLAPSLRALTAPVLVAARREAARR